MPSKKEVEFVTMQAFRPFARKVDDLHQWAFNGVSEKMENMNDLLPLMQEHMLEAKFFGKYGRKMVYILVSAASIAVAVSEIKKAFFS